MKKIISLLLSIAMIFSLAMPAMAAEGDTKTIYFDNTDGWATVNAYAWSGSGNSLGEWPGAAMTKVEDTESIYSIEVPTDAVNIIFNDGSNQTADLTIPTDGKDLYTFSTNTWSVYGDAGTPTPTPPSGGGSANDTSHDVTGTYTPTPEAKWGTSKDALTNSGTLDEAIAAAQTDSGITYIQLQKNLTTDTSYVITGGVFTLDLNGKTITGSSYNIDVRNSGTQVTLTDTATGGGGAVISDGEAYSAVLAFDGGKVVIDGGSYTGEYAVMVTQGSVAEIRDGTFIGTDHHAVSVDDASSSAIIEGGTFSGASAAIASSGNTTIKGGSFTGSNTYGAIAYWDGTLDLSGCNGNKLNGLTLSQWTGAALTVSDETIKLPAGYVFKNGEDNTVSILASYTTYTIGTEGIAEPSYSVTIDSAIYDGTVTVDENTVKQGETVTVVFTPSEGYVLFRSFAYDSRNPGNSVTLTPGTDENTFTFIMPAHDVTVSGIFVIDGKARDDLYFNNGGNTAWTNVNAYFYTSKGDWLEIVSLTMAENGIYTLPKGKEIPNLAYYVAFVCGSESTVSDLIPTGEENMFTLGSTTDTYDDYEGTWSKYTPSQPPEDTTSAEIVWGSMSFTYDDTIDESTKAEKGWTPAAEAGAGTVTVKNTGDTAFTAKVTYTAVAEYAEITGTFDADSADLAAETSKTFTLTLKNKPNKAITAGTKIGSVTIEIVNDSGSSDEDESDVTIVNDEQELKDAVAQGGKIKLGNDIALESQLMVESNVAIDLNEKTLSCSNDIVMSVYAETTVSISNGKIVGSDGTALINWGTLSIDNCTVTSTMKFLDNSAGTTVVTNSTLNGTADAYGGTITLHDNVTLGAGTNYDKDIGLYCSKDNSSIVCYFDPSEYLYESYGKQNVADNGDGTWTVTKAAE